MSKDSSPNSSAATAPSAVQLGTASAGDLPTLNGVVIGRRQALGSLAWVAGVSPLAATLGCREEDDAPDNRESALGANPGNTVTAPAWDAVPTCAASNTDGAGQGPFFIHDAEREDDIDLFRQDIRGRYDESAEPGTELELYVRILDGRSADCEASPVAGVEIYIWHTDAQGYYSGFGDAGDQRPDQPYAGVPNQNDLKNPDRFCRGAQVTDENGVVFFRSIFPGWYSGRDIHIHLLALRPGSASRGREAYAGGEHIFTTQFYFDPALSDQVHRASEPYLRRTALPAYAGAILADETNNSGLRAKASFDGRVVVAQMQVLLDP
jgi:protocatechuate 3,4-dioxygenase beta subunit